MKPCEVLKIMESIWTLEASDRNLSDGVPTYLTYPIFKTRYVPIFSCKTQRETHGFWVSRKQIGDFKEMAVCQNLVPL